LADRGKDRNADDRNNRDRNRLRNRRGDELNPNMEAAEEFDARNARRRRDNRRMEAAGELGTERNQDRKRDGCCDDDR
jgi:hypothetical protein